MSVKYYSRDTVRYDTLFNVDIYQLPNYIAQILNTKTKQQQQQIILQKFKTKN